MEDMHGHAAKRVQYVRTSKGTQNQYLLSEVLSGLVYVHEVYTGTE